jgi:hypothetical protein
MLAAIIIKVKNIYMRYGHAVVNLSFNKYQVLGLTGVQIDDLPHLI